jgi:hypothetical protein
VPDTHANSTHIVIGDPLPMRWTSVTIGFHQEFGLFPQYRINWVCFDVNLKLWCRFYLLKKELQYVSFFFI